MNKYQPEPTAELFFEALFDASFEDRHQPTAPEVFLALLRQMSQRPPADHELLFLLYLLTDGAESNTLNASEIDKVSIDLAVSSRQLSHWRRLSRDRSSPAFKVELTYLPNSNATAFSLSAKRLMFSASRAIVRAAISLGSFIARSAPLNK